MPVINGSVELNARICGCPGCVADLIPQFTRINSLGRRACCASGQFSWIVESDVNRNGLDCALEWRSNDRDRYVWLWPGIDGLFPIGAQVFKILNGRVLPRQFGGASHIGL